MLEDINTSIVWVQDAISKFQGDAENITLVGQSAGGHLACLALFKQVRAGRECTTYMVCMSSHHDDPSDVRRGQAGA